LFCICRSKVIWSTSCIVTDIAILGSIGEEGLSFPFRNCLWEKTRNNGVRGGCGSTKATWWINKRLYHFRKQTQIANRRVHTCRL
jgi:hypothetical protein